MTHIIFDTFLLIKKLYIGTLKRTEKHSLGSFTLSILTEVQVVTYLAIESAENGFFYFEGIIRSNVGV